jgi:tetratricopeptide (TPR) repeat protein
LYRQTGGKPLLLRWTAGQIGRGNCLTLADAVAYLRSCPEGNDPLEFIFGDLVEDFGEGETSVLCALAYFTLPAKVEHVAEVGGCAEADADRALRGLVNRSLVVPSEELKTFALVPLVADFLRTTRPEVVRETGDRLEKSAYALVVENGYEQYDRFPVLDAAWPTVAAALPYFLAGPNERIQTMCDALVDFLDFTGRWDESLGLASEAERRAVVERDLSNAGWRAHQAGMIRYRRQQSAEVLDCASRSEVHWREAEAGAREQAIALRLRGIGYELREDYPAAIAAYRESVELRRNLGHETRELALGLNDLGAVHQADGQFDDAERDYREALRISAAIGYQDGVSSFTSNLARLALQREDWIGAEALARKSLPVAEKLGKLDLIASTADCLAVALVRQDRKADALPHAKRAVDIFTRLGSPGLAGARATLAECES